jgi:hypothetical protein
MSFGEGGQEILVPTVAHDGSRILSDQEAIDQYRSSGKHLGMFSSPRDATAYAQQLHEDYERGKYDVYPGMEKLGALPGIPNPPPLPASPYWTPLSMLQRFSSQKRKTYGE